MSINNLNTYLNIKDSHLRVVSGNVYAQAMNIGGINVETAHGLQSVSDTGNVTSNTLQFSNAITGFVTTANAQIGRDLVVSGNTTVSTDLTVSANATVADTLTISEHLIASKEATITGNLHVTTIRSDSNVVTEYTGPHDRPLRKYPEVAMTANDNSSTSGYVASTSDVSGTDTSLRHVYTLFDHRVPDGTVTDGWMPGGGYNSVTGIANNSEIRFTGDPGEWVELQLPNSIKLTKFNLKPGGDSNNLSFAQRRFPKIIVIYGYNGTSWGKIQEYTTSTIQSLTDVQTFHISNPTTYHNKFVLIVKQTYSSGGAASSTTNIGEWELYGHEEGSGSLDTTLKTVYNVPATTGTQLEVYYDAKDLTTMPSIVTDLSPNTNNGTLNGGVGFNPTYKAFTFDGTDDYIEGAVTAETGAWSHTIAFWIKIDQIPSSGGMTVFQIKDSSLADNVDAATSTSPHLVINSGTGYINNAFQGNPGQFLDDNGNQLVAQTGVWQHYVVQYDASNGGTNYRDRKLIINGNKEYYPAGGTTTALSMVASNKLFIGCMANANLNGPGSFFDGSIANFRLYSKALNAGQVQELYDYQKDYFLGSKSQVTLYKGHLGVGVTEPSGQLELAGDERIQEYPPRAFDGGQQQDVGPNEVYIEGHGHFKAWTTAEYGDGNRYYEAGSAFNKKSGEGSDNQDRWVSGQFWANGVNASTPGTGLPTASAPTFAGYKGAHLILELPYAINLKRFIIGASGQGQSSYDIHSSQTASMFVIIASNDGNNWDTIFSHTATAGVATDYIDTVFSVNVTKAYSQYGYVALKNGNTSVYNHVTVGEWRLFGTPGPTTLDKGSLTLGRSLDVPRISRYDVDTETPRPEKLVVDFDTTVNSSPTDISGKGNHGIYHGTATYSAADKAFDSPNHSGILVRGSTLGSGAQPLTLCAWAKGTGNWNATANDCIIGVGPNSSSGNSSFQLCVNTDAITLDMASASNFVEYPVTITNNRWYFFAMTYSGGDAFTNTRVYLDGVEISKPASWTNGSSGTLSLPANPDIGVGTRTGNGSGNTPAGFLGGMISNPKLYNVVLEPSEVQKLYRLGRTGRSMVISDTAVGIGKVPEAQLDVRGDLRVGGRLLASVPYYSARQRDTNSYVFDESIVYDQYVYTNYPGSFVANSGTDGYYQPPMNGMYQVHMECIIQGEGNIIIQRLTNGTTDISHDNRHYNYTHSGWMAANADTLIPITNHTTQTIRIYIDGSTGNGAWAYASYHGSAFFLWVSDIPERRQHHVA